MGNDRLHATVKVAIVKPLGMTWDEAGKLLRGLQFVAHRIINRALLRMLAEDAGHREGAAKRLPLGKLRTLSYQAVNDAVEVEHDDKDAIASAVKLGMAGAAMEEYKRWRETEWKGERRFPLADGRAPIYVTSSGDTWGVARVDGSYVLSVKLTPGRTSKTRFVLGPDGGGAHAHMRRLVGGADVKLGDVKIVRDKRRKRWLACMSYSWPRPDRIDGLHVVALHRGVRSFLTAACTDGYAQELASGGDVLAIKAQMRARKRSLRKHVRECGSGARGHGRARQLATYQALENREARWVRTKCQQVAAAAVKFAKRRGASAILIEDYGTPGGDGDEHIDRLVRQWPFYQLKSAIEWACARAGIEAREVPASYISQRCPACGSVDAGQVSGEKFTCLQCTYRRGVDHTAALNMLSAGGFDDAVQATLRRGKDVVAALKAARKETQIAGAPAGPECEGSCTAEKAGPARNGARGAKSAKKSRKSIAVSASRAAAGGPRRPSRQHCRGNRSQSRGQCAGTT